MTENERIIDAFRNCITEPKCKDCPWDECDTLNNGRVEIPRDLALAVMRMLAEQEPRLLTMAEITGDGECWLECMNGACGYADIYTCAVAGMVEAWRCFRQEPEVLRMGGFRRVWRCWSHKPTDKQREEAEWDG